MSQRFALALIALVMIAGLAPQAASESALPYLRPPAIDTYNGTSWAGPVLEESTREGIEKRLQTRRSDFASGVELSQPKDLPVRIDVLFDGGAGNAPLVAICLRYPGEGPALETLTKAAGEKGKDRYEAGRFDDWRLVERLRRAGSQESAASDD